MVASIGHYIDNKPAAGKSGRSGDVTNPATGEVTAKVAFASVEEVDAAVAAARGAGCTDLTLLVCTSNYPADPREANLRRMQTLSDRFGTRTGLSDHTTGIAVSVAAVALGAMVIEKHVTLARADGGEAGLHPSNIHDNAYAVGAIDFTGDMPIILGPDGPSLGGFVCPAAVAQGELWKLGQLRPGDKVRFHAVDSDQAVALKKGKPVAYSATVPKGDVLRTYEGHDHVAYRRAGDDNILVEYGPMKLDFGLRLRVHLLMQAIEAGADLVAFGKGMDPAPYSLMAKKELKSIADLKGKSISLADAGDVYTEATKEIIRKGGLDPEKDINFRYGGNSNQRMAALVAGAVDAVPLIPPQDRMMTDQGFNSLAYYPDYFPNLTLSLSAVARPWASKNPEIMKSFMRAQKAAITWLYDPANKSEAIALLMTETNADRPSAEQAYDQFLIKMRIFPANGCIELKGLQVLVDILSRINKNVKGGPADKYVDTQWCAPA